MSRSASSFGVRLPESALSAIALPASLFRLLLLLLLSARTALDISITGHLVEGAERLAIKSDIFVVDSKASGPVAVKGVHSVCGGGRAGSRGVGVLCLGTHFGEAENLLE